MNKFKVEFINPTYGFKNYKIGNVTVYTLKVKVKNFSKSAILDLFHHFPNLGIENVGQFTYFTFETTKWKDMKDVRDLTWNMLYHHAKNKLERKYKQLKFEL